MPTIPVKSAIHHPTLCSLGFSHTSALSIFTRAELFPASWTLSGSALCRELASSGSSSGWLSAVRSQLQRTVTCSERPSLTSLASQNTAHACLQATRNHIFLLYCLYLKSRKSYLFTPLAPSPLWKLHQARDLAHCRMANAYHRVQLTVQPDRYALKE